MCDAQSNLGEMAVAKRRVQFVWYLLSTSPNWPTPESHLDLIPILYYSAGVYQGQHELYWIRPRLNR